MNSDYYYSNTKIGVSELRAITKAIKDTYGVDFSNYAISSFRRRIDRFLRLRKVGTINDLIHMTTENEEYFNFFLKEITVNVTEMFRDAAFWREFRQKIIPELAKKSRIKIWHAGCATGEEVFTMAIVLKEAGLLKKTQIIATDINQDVLKEASSGLYPYKKMDLNAKNYNSFQGKGILTDYYRKNHDQAIMDPELIRNVSYRVHDLVRHGEFDKFHVVMCRNVMIYFNKELQNRVYGIFADSLMKGGFLGIGTMESMESSSHRARFTHQGFEENMFKKIGD